MIDPLTWQLLSYSLFFKNNALREENEYRFVIIIYNTNGESKDYLLKSLKFKDSNGIKIPYLDILENFSDCYKSITIGPLSNEFTPSSLDLYLKYAKDGDDKIYKVKIDREKINKSNISYRW